MSHTVDSRRDKNRVKSVDKMADKMADNMEGSVGSHDFIKFPPRLGSFTPKTWMLMGEIQARIEELRRLPIPPEAGDELCRVYLAKGIQATTAIEGSTLTEAEVRDIIERRLDLPPSRKYLQQEVDNMLRAINAVGELTLSGDDGLYSLDRLNQWHSMILADLDEVTDDAVIVGGLREHHVVVGRYIGAPPSECERMAVAFCDWLNDEDVAPAKHQRYALAWQVVKAVVAHLMLAFIHPYGDGNGRLSRLVEFDLLLRAGVPDIAAHLLSNFYNATRTRYRQELQNAHGDYIDGAYPSEINLLDFLEYALEGYRDALVKQFRLIRRQLQSVIWHDTIHRSFPKRMTATQQRRKQLALSMTELEAGEAVSVSSIRELTPALAAAYANLSDRTIVRDLNALVSLQLLRREASGYMPNTDILLAFSSTVRPKP